MLYHHKGPKTLFTKMFLLQAVHILHLLKPHIILIKKLLLQFWYSLCGHQGTINKSCIIFTLSVEHIYLGNWCFYRCTPLILKHVQRWWVLWIRSILLVTEMHVLTEIKKNLFSLTAPKHPTIATMMTTTPAAIIRPGTIT